MEDTMPLSKNNASPTAQIARKRVQESQKWLRFAWALHFIVTLMVLACGIYVNGGTRKYIPIRPSGVSSDCRKAFVNTIASSAEDEDGIICCNDSYTFGICAPKPKYLFFAGRLTRFPEAWLLPLFPFIIRLAVVLLQKLTGRTSIYSNRNTVLVRLCFYIVVMNFRGWVLFLLFNHLEDNFFLSPVNGVCWYGDLLKSHQSSCYGRQFDFSDHAVLFFAQILPIALMEVLHCFVVPFWEVSPSTATSRPWFSRLTPVILMLCLAHLYVLCLMGVYKTALYFHTGPEMLLGYGMSLLGQMPLAFLQCFPVWGKARQIVFGFPSLRKS